MTSDNNKELIVKYRLKSMVLARILAELTVVLILLILPVVAIAAGIFWGLALPWKVIIVSLAVLSLIFMPAYGFITWQVVVSEKGLEAKSLLQKKKLPWSRVKSISRRSNWNWQRYVVESEDDKDLSFPIWLKDVDKLVATIKSRLPGGGASGASPFRRFTQDPISLAFQFLQASFGIALTVVFWMFFLELWNQHKTSNSDLIILLAFVLILSSCVLWRTFIILLMPKRVQITPPSLIIDTLFYTKEYQWQEVKGIKNANPLLPDGFVIKAKRQTYLIGSGMDAADELMSSVESNIVKK